LLGRLQPHSTSENHIPVTTRIDKNTLSYNSHIFPNSHPIDVILTPLCSTGPNSVTLYLVQLHCLQNCTFRASLIQRISDRDFWTSFIEKPLALSILNGLTKFSQILNPHTLNTVCSRGYCSWITTCCATATNAQRTKIRKNRLHHVFSR